MNTTLKQLTSFVAFSLLTLFCYAQSVEVITENKIIAELTKADFKTLLKLRCVSGDNDPCIMILDGDDISCDCEDSRMEITSNDDGNIIPEDLRKVFMESVKRQLADNATNLKSFEYFMFDSKIYLHCIYLEAGVEKEVLIVETSE